MTGYWFRSFALIETDGALNEGPAAAAFFLGDSL
jgi:hypothetical protein